MEFGSKLIHNGFDKDKYTGGLSIPIYQASTYHQEDVFKSQEYEYSRSGNPTRKALEEIIAQLEGGFKGFAFSSGMAAISSVFSLFSQGDHVIVCEDVYGGTARVVTKHFSRMGIEFTFVNSQDLDAVKNAVKKNSKGLFLETPSNPTLKITDLKGAAQIAKDNNLVSIIDNTFMTPYLQRPIELGIDIVIHSATKFIGGHSDVVAGLVVASNKNLSDKIYAIQNGFGSILGPFDSWLLLRGLKTLKVRMDYQQENAIKIAEWLTNHPNIRQVYYPSLIDHPSRDIHYSQAKGPGAVFSFATNNSEIATSFLKRIKLAAVAVSLGGVETIVSYPVTMSHASMPENKRERLGITSELIRVSVGLEDVDDLIDDFKKALK